MSASAAIIAACVRKETPCARLACDEPSKTQEMQRRTIRTTHLPFSGVRASRKFARMRLSKLSRELDEENNERRKESRMGRPPRPPQIWPDSSTRTGGERVMRTGAQQIGCPRGVRLEGARRRRARHRAHKSRTPTQLFKLRVDKVASRGGR